MSREATQRRGAAVRLFSVAALLLLGGCASAPIPDYSYFKLPVADAPARLPAPLFVDPIVVDTLLADGVHSQQGILYQLALDGSVRSYHYQLWNDPPVRLLQRRLIRRLRDEGAAPLVTDRLPTRVVAVRVGGLLERFERVKTADGWEAAVRIEMRVERGQESLPALLESYEATETADGESIQATVRAFARATDRVFDAFIADLSELGR